MKGLFIDLFLVASMACTLSKFKGEKNHTEPSSNCVLEINMTIFPP